MRIIYNRFLPFPGYTAVNLFGVLFVRKEHKGKTGVKFRMMVTHETIHTKQMQEMGYIFFYIWYLVEWLIKCLWYFSPTKAYYAILSNGRPMISNGTLPIPQKGDILPG